MQARATSRGRLGGGYGTSQLKVYARVIVHKMEGACENCVEADCGRDEG